MFDFRKISISDKDRIKNCLEVSDFRGCEYSFANNLAWHRLSDTVITFYNDFYLPCSFENNKPFFTFPSGVEIDNTGREKYIELIEELKKYTDNNNHKLVISSVNSDNLIWLKEYYGEKIAVSTDSANYDYIYNASDLITMAGKKFHSKRNHIKHFKEHDWFFRPVNKSDFSDCIIFAAESYNNTETDNFSAAVEQYAINTYFNNFDELNLSGGVLYCDGKLCGFSIGEKLNSDTFVVHIEKADSSLQGAYPALCNEFAKAFASNFKYINREEDLGIEGLRKSKQSYHPVFLQEKYTISFN